jgi:hypothetical protein
MMNGREPAEKVSGVDLPASHFARLGVLELQTDKPTGRDKRRLGVCAYFMQTSLENARNMAVVGITTKILDFLFRKIMHKAMCIEIQLIPAI